MLKLRSSPASPFGRKVKVAAEILGLKDQIEIILANTMDESDSLRQENPLGKIPILLLEDGSTLFDSRVILEYLDWKAGGGKILPALPEARFEALRLQATADGLMDAGMLLLYEGRFRAAEKHEPKWINHQQGKLNRAFDALEASPPSPATALPNVGQITLACALGWFDFRFDGAWRKDRPKLAAWYEHFRTAVPAFDHSAPKG